MSGQNIKKCSIRGCPGNLKLERRHVFRFPKEHDRWLQWIRSSGRLDLEEKGPEYSSRNCRLCSLHFEEKWFKISNRRILLHSDAVPTRFGKDLESFSKT
ncbi:52 kDa repressor of the inhibitor of the protein kinase-like [Monomorium pharaonis]|uniref:52 kDa repressor of the inhibitor of the protein kinase-like n=1 Tax=Monomorium pharaonis TaxID=307658 RepID=UPI0017466E4C|nr:52 kDa repressor of the inhibitor of the protein kinase-like [Monomorium pharaonis]